MYTAALIYNSWDMKATCPSTEEWIKMWFIYSIEYYITIEKNEIMSFAGTRMDLETVILNEISQTEKQISYTVYMWNFLKNGTNKLIYKTETDAENNLMVTRGVRREEG